LATWVMEGMAATEGMEGMEETEAAMVVTGDRLALPAVPAKLDCLLMTRYSPFHVSCGLNVTVCSPDITLSLYEMNYQSMPLY